ncbi:hypothetical protein AAG906_019350 [Vitis piasezkii]
MSHNNCYLKCRQHCFRASYYITGIILWSSCEANSQQALCFVSAGQRINMSFRSSSKGLRKEFFLPSVQADSSSLHQALKEKVKILEQEELKVNSLLPLPAVRKYQSLFFQAGSRQRQLPLHSRCLRQQDRAQPKSLLAQGRSPFLAPSGIIL